MSAFGSLCCILVFCSFFFCYGWIRHLVRCHSIDSSVFLYLLDQFNTREEIHAKVYEFPLNALLRVFFLFENEHVVIEELLELLIGEVDAQLLEAVELFEQQSGMLVFCQCVQLCRFSRFLFFWRLTSYTTTVNFTLAPGYSCLRYQVLGQGIGQSVRQVIRQIFHSQCILKSTN